MIDKAVSSANGYIFDLEARLNAERHKMIMQTKPGMHYIELTEEEIDAFRKKAAPLQEKYLEMGGEGAREVLDAVMKDKAWAEQQ